MRSSKKDIYVYLETNKDLKNPEFVRKLFSVWRNEAGGTYPERWGIDERLRNDIGDLSGLISKWTRPVPAFGRQSSPQGFHQIDWPIGLSHQHRRFPGSMVSYLSHKTPPNDVRDFENLLSKAFRPEYLAMTTWADAESRHFLPLIESRPEI